MEPVEKGGWSVFQTSWSGLDQATPAGHPFLRGNGPKAAPGWPNSPALEALRDDWLRAGGLPAQKALAERMQLQALQDVPYVPLGQQFQQTAHRAEIAGIQPGMPVFWGVQRG
jgi:peptide/nickel transport system substrate-binding protein